jgi:putative addiction module CopG family antidote
MLQFNISLPEPLAGYVRAQIDEGRYPSLEDYVRTLIEADQQERYVLQAWFHDPRVGALVIEGIESGDAGPMTKQDWDALKRPLLEPTRTNSHRAE